MTTNLQDEQKQTDGPAYYPYTCDFTDDTGNDVRATIQFRRPGRQHIIQLSKSGPAKTYDVTRNILLELCHSDDKPRLAELMKNYPLLVTSFSDEIFRKAGAGSVFAGK